MIEYTVGNTKETEAIISGYLRSNINKYTPNEIIDTINLFFERVIIFDILEPILGEKQIEKCKSFCLSQTMFQYLIE